MPTGRRWKCTHELRPRLSTAWACVIAFAIFAYVVMDGFDLGIGILFPFLKVGPSGMMMNSIAPVWDGNETWLVLGGGGLLAAFPLAYAIILPATYPLIIAMLLGLVFRGVAFEFRWRHAPSPALGRGVHHRLGRDASAGHRARRHSSGYLGASDAARRLAYAGGWLDWLSPFSLLTGASLLVGYALLGACWLVWKTEASGQAHARRMAFWLAIAMLVALAAVSAATPFLSYAYWRRWSAVPGVFVTAQVPLLVLVTAVLFFRSLARGGERLPFLFLALGLFARVRRARGQHVSLHRAAEPDDLAGAAPAQSQCSCSSAPPSSFPRFWPIPAGPIGCSAARLPPRGITDAGAALAASRVAGRDLAGERRRTRLGGRTATVVADGFSLNGGQALQALQSIPIRDQNYRTKRLD
jgi:cytochrome d ubiquinol oxidase subunit II